MKPLINCLAVGGAGFFGALARYGVSVAYGRLVGATSFPIATMIINVSGSAFLGWFVSYMGTRYTGPHHETLRLAVAIGFVGAYTTFSTYMFETDKLFHDRSYAMSALYLVGSLVLGLIGVELGLRLGRG